MQFFLSTYLPYFLSDRYRKQIIYFLGLRHSIPIFRLLLSAFSKYGLSLLLTGRTSAGVSIEPALVAMFPESKKIRIVLETRCLVNGAMSVASQTSLVLYANYPPKQCSCSMSPVSATYAPGDKATLKCDGCVDDNDIKAYTFYCKYTVFLHETIKWRACSDGRVV